MNAVPHRVLAWPLIVILLTPLAAQLLYCVLRAQSGRGIRPGSFEPPWGIVWIAAWCFSAFAACTALLVFLAWLKSS
jgi:hypothetical protein